MSPHIFNEYVKMARELGKEFSCPICLENITLGSQPSECQLTLSKCGHQYCRPCWQKLKNTDDPRCAVCREDL